MHTSTSNWSTNVELLDLETAVAISVVDTAIRL